MNKWKDKNIIKYRFNKISSVVLGLLLIMILVGWYFKKEGYYPVYVVTGSMSPTIQIHGIAIVREYNQNRDKIEVGDIVVFRPIKLRYNVIHRIIGVEGEGYYTKGDNNQYRDNEILTKDRIIAKVVKVYNGGVPFLKFVFGDISDISKVKPLRIAAGFFILAFLIWFIYIIYNIIVDYITINHAYYKTKEVLKTDYMGYERDRIVKSEIELLIKRVEGTKGINRIIINILTIILYNFLYEEEKQVRRSRKIYKYIIKFLDRLEIKKNKRM